MKSRRTKKLLQCLCLAATLAGGGAALADPSAPTLFEKIGGEAKLRAAMHEFVLIIESDDRINFTFANTDLKKFEQLLYEQFCNLSQGGCKYTGRDMYTAHAKLNINNAEFNALTEDLSLQGLRPGARALPVTGTGWWPCSPRCSTTW